MSARLILARHGETEWHTENRYAGSRSAPDLTERGRGQATELAAAAVRLGVDVVVSSTLTRAVDTATPAAETLGVELVTRPDLREVDFGELEGRTIAEADPRLMERFVADPAAHPFPGAEPPADAAARAVAALRDLDATHDGAAVLVVAHSTLLRLALCQLLGISLSHYRRVFPRLDNVARTEIRLPADPTKPAALLAFNVLKGTQ